MKKWLNKFFKNKSSRFLKDRALQSFISVISLIGLIVLIAVFGYVFQRGSALISWDLITGNYNVDRENVYYEGEVLTKDFTAPNDLEEDEYFSTRWGIAIKDGENASGVHIVYISYVDPKSPLRNMKVYSPTVATQVGDYLGEITFQDSEGIEYVVSTSQSAEIAINSFNIYGLITNTYLTTSDGDLETEDEAKNVYYNGDEITTNDFIAPDTLAEDEYFSSKWGIAIKNGVDELGEEVFVITYIDANSPLKQMKTQKQVISVTAGATFETTIFQDSEGIYKVMLPSQGAENALEYFENYGIIYDTYVTTAGGGIRGSIITTLYLILFTLIIALPFGIFTAIYLHEFAPKNSKIVNLIRRMVEMLTGVPSIVYGLLGAAVFIPFVNSFTGKTGGSILSGSLTMAIIILPVIISNTEESLKTIPDEYRQASLALGANKTQTTFKVILKSSLPGILSATLLSIGRIIGESAALIYSIGAVISDRIVVTNSSTSLAVHIWTEMAGESPNFEVASAISIIILLVVLVLNLSVKLIVRKISY